MVPVKIRGQRDLERILHREGAKLSDCAIGLAVNRATPLDRFHGQALPEVRC